jgi:hypothetical protein
LRVLAGQQISVLDHMGLPVRSLLEDRPAVAQRPGEQPRSVSAVPNSISSSSLSEVILRPANGQRPFPSRAASSAAGPWQTAAMTFAALSASTRTRPMSGSL